LSLLWMSQPVQRQCTGEKVLTDPEHQAQLHWLILSTKPGTYFLLLVG